VQKTEEQRGNRSRLMETPDWISGEAATGAVFSF
jgi:hypothetical protein